MNKKDLVSLMEAYTDIVATPHTETPAEMESEKIEMVETNLRSDQKHAALLLHRIIEGSVDIPPWAEEKIAIATHMLVSIADTLMSRE
jgi:hypothetical protein